MTINTRLKAFLESEHGSIVRKELVKMAMSQDYNTTAMYSVNDPEGLTFVDRQMRYMSQYPTMNHIQYISNLKMKTKRSK
ncbi:TPA: hypothetical protein DD425_03470 [Candidatus Saccharibacteria bacterium]|nr:hypothetical protein [Candidatus Saccharibacteria bacterium]HBO64993.1 hypothetical protein [Candidatus Saccharibacteria bacterium]|tara:strand:+ start:164 stop:403 length:240 start_codon:yes stop_codon:yes gene_type:complete